MTRFGGWSRSTSHIAAVRHASVGPPETSHIALLPISPVHGLLSLAAGPFTGRSHHFRGTEVATQSIPKRALYPIHFPYIVRH